MNLPGVKSAMPACDHDECSDPRFCRYWSQENIYLQAFAAGVQQAANAVLEHHLHGKDRTARGYYDAILATRDAKKGEK